jgi:hypothetical protein
MIPGCRFLIVDCYSTVKPLVLAIFICVHRCPSVVNSNLCNLWTNSQNEAL